MDTMVDYTDSILDNFRSDVFDAIMIYGFTVRNAETGIVKAKLKILDGLRLSIVNSINLIPMFEKL